MLIYRLTPRTVVSEDIYQTSVVPCRLCVLIRFGSAVDTVAQPTSFPLSLSLPSFLFILPPASLPPLESGKWKFKGENTISEMNYFSGLISRLNIAKERLRESKVNSNYKNWSTHIECE